MAIMVVLCLCWGLNQVGIKIANAGFSPIFQAGLRSVGACILLWLWMRWRGIPLFRRDGSLWVGILVGLLFAGEFLFLYWGLVHTGASRAVLFLYTAPFIVALGVHFLVPGEQLRGLQVIGLLAAFGGVVLAFGDSLRLPSGEELYGDALCFIGAVFWGLSTVLVKASRLALLSPSKTLLYQLVVSAVVLLAASAAIGEPGVTDPTLLMFACLAYQIVVIAFISYLTWFWLISRYPASRISAFSFLTPLFGLAAGAILLAEPVTSLLLLAMLLVAAGIYLVNRRDAVLPALAAVEVPLSGQQQGP